MIVQHIAVDLEDGRTVAMQVVTDDGRGIKQEATSERVASIIAKSRLPARAWRRIDAAEAARISAALRAD